MRSIRQAKGAPPLLRPQYIRPAQAPTNSVGVRPDCRYLQGESTETQCPEKLGTDHAVSRRFMVAFVSGNRPSRFRTQDSIDGTTIVPDASEPALHLYNQLDIAVAGAVVVVTVVVVRIVGIGIRIEDRKAKRVDEDEPPIAEMAKMMGARHCP